MDDLPITEQLEFFPADSRLSRKAALRVTHERKAETVREAPRRKGRPVQDLSGERFGKLVVVRMTDERLSGGIVYEAQCDCGASILVSRQTLRNYARSRQGGHCGCLGVGKAGRIAPGALGISGSKWRKRIPAAVAALNTLYANYRQGATTRGYEWKLSKAQFYHLTQQDCAYCGASPSNEVQARNTGERSQFTYNGVDRVDNTQGYTPENTVSCCALCNHIKGTLTVDELLQWVERVYHRSKAG